MTTTTTTTTTTTAAAAAANNTTHISYKKLIYSSKCDTLKYLKITVTNQYYTHGYIKGRLNSGNACYHSIHDLLQSHLYVELGLTP
jgi:hypothetical protein